MAAMIKVSAVTIKPTKKTVLVKFKEEDEGSAPGGYKRDVLSCQKKDIRGWGEGLDFGAGVGPPCTNLHYLQQRTGAIIKASSAFPCFHSFTLNLLCFSNIVSRAFPFSLREKALGTR